MGKKHPKQELTPHANKCGAKTRSGHPCKNSAMPNGRCRMHGGKSLKGIASPTATAGLKYSRYLPNRLLERYEQTINDPAILELGHEIALTDGRLADLLSRVDTGESGALWAHLKKLWREYEVATKSENRVEAMKLMIMIGQTITQGYDDYLAWQEVQTTVDQRRKLVESERKRLVETQQFITAEQAMVLFAAMTAIIKQHVTDEHTRRVISEEITTLIQ